MDFGPYLKGILHSVQQKWLTFIPEKAREPTSAKAVTMIRFTINPDGRVAAMHLHASTHDVEFDKAAWGAITNQKPFPPLPASFTGPNLEIRVQFRVNMPADQRDPD